MTLDISRVKQSLLMVEPICLGQVNGVTTMDTILRLPDAKRSTGLSRSTIYLRISLGTFPKPVSLGGRAVGWLEAEVHQWLQRRIEASRSESSGVGATLGAPRKFELKTIRTHRYLYQ